MPKEVAEKSNLEPIIDFLQGKRKAGRPHAPFVVVQTKLGPREITLTRKQILYLQFRSMGLSKRQASLKAGYATTSSNSGKASNSLAIKTAMQELSTELKNIGITPAYLSLKFKEWFEAEKMVSTKAGPMPAGPDYETQIKAYDRYKDVVEPKSEERQGFKKKITLEEYTYGPESSDEIIDETTQ